MAPKEAPSFDAIIEAERRKKSAVLANEIFGRGRKDTKGDSSGNSRRPGVGPSLASRIGVTKASSRSPVTRTVSLGANFKQSTKSRNERGPKPNPQNGRDARNGHQSREDRLYKLAADNKAPVSPVALSNMASNGNGMSIRGLAGPTVVMASNFAPGTTSADIESAMVPIGGEMQSCRLVASNPTVIAEMVFLDRTGAENVITTFNGQKADGRTLYVHFKTGPSPPAAIAAPALSIPTTTPSVLSPPPQNQASKSPLSNNGRSHYLNNAYDSHRAEADNLRNARRADPEFQDGRYGFAGEDNDRDINAMEVDMEVEERPAPGTTERGPPQQPRLNQDMRRGGDDNRRMDGRDERKYDQGRRDDYRRGGRGDVWGGRDGGMGSSSGRGNGQMGPRLYSDDMNYRSRARQY